MEIAIYSESIVIRLENDIRYDMTYKQLADVETAIEIIRNIQKSAHIETCTINIT